MFSSLKFSKSKKKNSNEQKHSNKWSLDNGLCTKSKLDDTDITVRHSRTSLKNNPQTENYLEYANNSDVTKSRIIGVSLNRDEKEGFGITLKKIDKKNLVVTKIKPQASAYKEGTIKVGDRLLALNGTNLCNLSLLEAQNLLLKSASPAWITVEYDVAEMSYVRSAGRPLIVEIDSKESYYAEGNDLGLSLSDAPNGKILISNVKPASIAERCGALLPGDEILAINNLRKEDNVHLKSNDFMKVIKHSVKNICLLQIEILPVFSLNNSNNSFYNEFDDLNSSRDSFITQYQNFHENYHNYQINNNLTDLRIENGLVTLHSPFFGGFGLKLRCIPSKIAAVICDIEPNGIADRSGVLQIGDRVTSINGVQVADCANFNFSHCLTVVLTVQFDVIWKPLSDINNHKYYEVTLSRSMASGFGITVNGCTGGGIIITDICWGSAAHRCGLLSIGDEIMAIDGRSTGGDLPKVREILENCGESVIIIIKKRQNDQRYSSGAEVPSIDSAVESLDENHPEQNQWNERSHLRNSSINSHAISNLEAELKIVAAAQKSPKSIKMLKTDRPKSVLNNKNYLQLEVTLEKDPVYEDFGFSVSDGLYEKGVFIHNIRPNGPADLSRMLQPYDRIIQVNETKTIDFDCCLTVPLVAATGNKLILVIIRALTPNKNYSSNANNDDISSTETSTAKFNTKTI